MNAYIGRQPIFDRYNRIAGYELLYRDLHNQDAAKIGDEDKATRTVLSDTVTVWGMRTLTNGLPAYINFTRNLIMTDFIRQANPEEVIPMIKEDTQIDETLLEKIRDLRKVTNLPFRVTPDSQNSVPSRGCAMSFAWTSPASIPYNGAILQEISPGRVWNCSPARWNHSPTLPPLKIPAILFFRVIILKNRNVWSANCPRFLNPHTGV